MHGAAMRQERAVRPVEADADAVEPVDGAMQNAEGDANAVYVVDDPDEDNDFMNQEFFTAPGDAAQASARRSERSTGRGDVGQRVAQRRAYRRAGCRGEGPERNPRRRARRAGAAGTDRRFAKRDTH